MLETNLVFFIFVGFIAQMIDGAIGMAYGIGASSMLLALGIPPAVASASVHTSEMFTTLVSGLSHLKFKNIDVALFKKLVIPGMLGGAIGAVILTQTPIYIIKPVVALYLLAMGIFVFIKAFKPIKTKPVHGRVSFLGFIGGLLDAIGGGGWGPIVTTTLTARGNNPRFAVGSANAVEFFVTVLISGILVPIVGITYWQVVVGLLIGGVVAAPFAAYVCKRMPPRHMMVIISVIIALLSARTLYLIFK